MEWRSSLSNFWFYDSYQIQIKTRCIKTLAFIAICVYSVLTDQNLLISIVANAIDSKGALDEINENLFSAVEDGYQLDEIMKLMLERC